MTSFGRRTVYQYHFMSWPDKSVPKDPGPLLQYMHVINHRLESISDSGPMLVHCRCVQHALSMNYEVVIIINIKVLQTHVVYILILIGFGLVVTLCNFSAGIGRTGAFIVIDMILNNIKERGNILSGKSGKTVNNNKCQGY